jgi:hypothetical protein
VHAAISETNGTIFSSSFKVGIMIEIELEDADESIILKRQTFNAQPAFGKPTPKVFACRRRRSNVQSSDSNNSQSSACQAVASDKKLHGIKRFASVGAYGVTLSLSTLLRVKAGADDGIRTRDLRFTKPLLYQLSYVGAERCKHCIVVTLRQGERCSLKIVVAGKSHQFRAARCVREFL